MPELTTTPEQWLQRAAEAADQLDFDVCVARGLPFFAGDIDRAEKVRETLFGRWYPERARAYLAGVQRYVSTRTDLEQSGWSVLSAHTEAKAKAKAAYIQALERQS